MTSYRRNASTLIQHLFNFFVIRSESICLVYTSAYIRCAHSGTSTLALRARLRRCASLHHHHHKKKKIKKKKNNRPRQELNMHADLFRLIVQRLIHSATKMLWLSAKASYVYLAENALNALLSSAWDNGVSQSVSQSVSE